MKRSTIIALSLLWFLLLMLSVLFVRPAKAAGERCHGLRPSCPLGAQAVCLCLSKGCLDSKCRWVCGVLAGLTLGGCCQLAPVCDRFGLEGQPGGTIWFCEDVPPRVDCSYEGERESDGRSIYICPEGAR